MGLGSALFTALNKDSCELYHEHVPFDPATAQELSDKAVDRAARRGCGRAAAADRDQPRLLSLPVLPVLGTLLGGGAAMSCHSNPLRMSDTADETWKIVASFPAYEVSDRGRVRRRLTKGRWPAGHILSPGQARSGHLYVMLTDAKGCVQKQFIHRLVAIAFVGPAPFEGAFVLHHDDRPQHNVPENLYWGDRRQNARDAKLNRRYPGEVSQRGAQPGTANPATVLTERDVLQIRRYLDMGLCGACVARLYGVRKETIYCIAKGRTWAHLRSDAA
jgi:hypothetical protein